MIASIHSDESPMIYNSRGGGVGGGGGGRERERQTDRQTDRQRNREVRANFIIMKEYVQIVV